MDVVERFQFQLVKEGKEIVLRLDVGCDDPKTIDIAESILIIVQHLCKESDLDFEEAIAEAKKTYKDIQFQKCEDDLLN